MVLLDEKALISKLSILRQTLHTWNELLMMLDQNSSGNLNTVELRCSLMGKPTSNHGNNYLNRVPLDKS